MANIPSFVRRPAAPGAPGSAELAAGFRDVLLGIAGVA
jgi:hypothetical protein